MSDPKVTAVLDVTEDTCPLTFVRTKLKLEELQPGDVLEVILREGLQNVASSVKAEGHRVLKVDTLGGQYRLLIERGE